MQSKQTTEVRRGSKHLWSTMDLWDRDYEERQKSLKELRTRELKHGGDLMQGTFRTKTVLPVSLIWAQLAGDAVTDSLKDDIAVQFLSQVDGWQTFNN